jgi:hypothetical protein
MSRALVFLGWRLFDCERGGGVKENVRDRGIEEGERVALLRSIHQVFEGPTRIRFAAAAEKNELGDVDSAGTCFGFMHPGQGAFDVACQLALREAGLLSQRAQQAGDRAIDGGVLRFGRHTRIMKLAGLCSGFPNKSMALRGIFQPFTLFACGSGWA